MSEMMNLLARRFALGFALICSWNATHLATAEERDLLIVAGQSSAVGDDARPGELPADANDQAEARLHADRRQITIVTLGDSITKGVRGGVSAEQTFAALIETQLPPEVSGRVKNVGIGGERTDQALERLDQIVALQPDIVTIMYGTNDSYVDQGKTESRITVDEYRNNLSNIVSELLRRGIQPILMTEPRWSDDASPNGLGENPNIRLEPYIVVCRETAREWRVPLIDHFAKWSDARANGVNLREWTTDGCHPNPAGHRELTSLILPELHRAIGPDFRTRQKLLAGEPVRVVCFGDSVTGVYYHTGSRRAYTDMLGIALRRFAPRAKVKMINAGISGHTTVNALARIDRDVLSHKPDLVTVMFGLNDITRVPIDQYRANLVEIVSKCRASGAEVILATPNNVVTTAARPTEKLMEYCDVVRAVGLEQNVPVCDCYRELDALRAHDEFQWRLLMSDEIHPNMDGHQRLATALTQTITGRRISLDDVAPFQPALARTFPLLRDGKPVRILAMEPFDRLIEPAIHAVFPESKLTVESWSVAGMTLAEIEQDAKAKVRTMKPDLVLIAVPRSAVADSDESFARSYAWTMNWSLNFGPPTWDCVVIHPSVHESTPGTSDRDDLIRKLVAAQDLGLIDRPSGSQADAATILGEWIRTLAIKTP
ncbi:MAG TPA: GDSL-type esterase/lipase family protein [Planctomycetaceae bacterium]|nr:GDSL-type esterase/lipase family protein [Planctomycetaceae bacterium]